MAIIKGSTATIKVSMPEVLISAIDSIIFSFGQKPNDIILQKEYPTDVAFDNNIFYIMLNQEETSKFNDFVYMEGQINYNDKSVVKTIKDRIAVDDTLFTEMVEGNKANKEQTEKVELTSSTVVYLNIAFDTIKNSVELCKNAAEVSEEAIAAKDTAVSSAAAAKQSEENAKKSATEAGNSKVITEQAMKDLLAMYGTKFATLTEYGKLTPSQIPNLSIINSYAITDVSELVTLDAQLGDMAYIQVDGKVTDVYWLADNDATVADNWLKFGVSFVQNAGNAQTAVEAENAQKINGHRLVEMAANEFEAAVKDDNTYYLVY